MARCVHKSIGKRACFVSFILFISALKSTIADVILDTGFKPISSLSETDKKSKILMTLKTNRRNHRRLDRPPSVSAKGPKKDVRDEIESSQASTKMKTTTDQDQATSENDSETTLENEPNNDDEKDKDSTETDEGSGIDTQSENKNEVVSLPDYNELEDPKTEAASKKGQCFSAFSCNQCKVIADRLEKDSDELYTCAWKSQAQITEEASPSDSSGNNTSAAGSLSKAGDLDIKSGLCVGVYKTYAENEPMAGKNLKCDAKSLEAAALNAATSVSAVKKTTAGTENGDPDLLFGTSKGSDHSYTFLMILALLVGSVFIKKKIQKGQISSVTMGKMLEVMNADLEMGNTNGSNRFARESVPLSTAREDEWGWEEENFQNGAESRSLHMQMQKEQREEEEDMQMALALSLSAQSNNNSNSSSLIMQQSETGTRKRSPPVRSKSFNRHTVIAPIQSSTSSSLRKPTPLSTKVDKSSNNIKNSIQSKQPQPPNPDIFSTMGLSAKPTFRSNSSLTPKTAPTNAKEEQKTTTTNSAYSSGFVSNVPSASYDPKSSALNDDESSVGTNPNWEDDDDLDDLLGD